MSSAVNKSQKKFVPKVASRGPGRQPGRRLSTLRASFSVPAENARRNANDAGSAPVDAAAASQTPQLDAESPRTRADLLGLGPAPSYSDEAAIDDEPLKRPLSAALATPDATQTEPFAAKRPRTRSRGAEDAPNPPNRAGPPTQDLRPNSPPPAPEPAAKALSPAAQLPAVPPAASRRLKLPSLRAPSSAPLPASSRPADAAKPAPASKLAIPKVSEPHRVPARPQSAPETGAEAPDTLQDLTVDKPVEKPAEKPSAPAGFEYIWPEDLPKRRAAERKRKAAVERELLALMRSLYAAKERERLVADGMDADLAVEEAERLTAAATYHHLKQKVGNEAKQQRAEMAGRGEGSGEGSGRGSGRGSGEGSGSSSSGTDTGEGRGTGEGEGEGEGPYSADKTLLDVNKFTMAALCKDLPVGDRNKGYDDYELARVNRRRDTVRVFRAKMWSRRMYEPKESERAELRAAYQKYQSELRDRTGKLKSEQQQKFTEIDANAEESGGASSHAAAAIEIQANGDISLVGTQFDRHKHNRAQREGSSGPKTEVDPTEQVINSYSYSTRERPDRWTPEETAKFYEAVSALGTDFNLISHLFPTRSRNQIKTKYKYEERRNPAKLQIHLVSRRKFSLDSYAKVSKVAIEEVDAIESEFEAVRQEHEAQMKVEEVSRQNARSEDQRRAQERRPKSEH